MVLSFWFFYIAESEFQISHFELRISKFSFRPSNLITKVREPKSLYARQNKFEIRNPKSDILIRTAAPPVDRPSWRAAQGCSTPATPPESIPPKLQRKSSRVSASHQTANSR